MIAPLFIVVALSLAPPTTNSATRVEDAAVQLREALRADDRAAARGLLVAPASMDAKLPEAYLELLFAAERLRQAIETAFPHDRGAAPTTASSTAPAAPLSLAVRVVRQDARSADVELAPDAPPARFVLTDSGWRLDLSAVFPEGEDAQRQCDVALGLAAVLDELRGEILAERYVSLVDVRAVMAMRTSDLLANLSQRRAATAPAR